MNVLRPNFEKRNGKNLDGLVVVIAQEVDSNGKPGAILMQAYTNEAGYRETLATGKAVYFSTSRNERWCKGETSGDFQKVVGVRVDCDGDAIIYFVEQQGAGACHTRAHSCFYRCAISGADVMSVPNAGPKEQLEVFGDIHVADELMKRLEAQRGD